MNGRRTTSDHAIWRARPTAEQADVIEDGFVKALAALQAARYQMSRPLIEAATCLSRCFAAGGKALVCGNGGSAADAQHFAAELVGRFRLDERPGLPALALTADSAVLTAWSNDFSYDDVFARQVEAFGRSGDVLLVISTSGHSPNLLAALAAANRQGLVTIGLLGGGGGRARRLVDVALVVPAEDTPRIQEVHIVLLHLLCELVEGEFTPRGAAEKISEGRTNGRLDYGERDHDG